MRACIIIYIFWFVFDTSHILVWTKSFYNLIFFFYLRFLMCVILIVFWSNTLFKWVSFKYLLIPTVFNLFKGLVDSIILIQLILSNIRNTLFWNELLLLLLIFSLRLEYLCVFWIFNGHWLSFILFKHMFIT